MCVKYIVTLRFDDEPAQTYNTNLSSTGESLFFPEPKELLMQIRAHDEMLFEFTPFNATSDVTSFDLRGAADAMSPILKACAGK